MRSLLWLLLAVLALSGLGVHAKFANPRTDPAGCGREGVASSHVCDPEKLLAPEAADRVDLVARALTSGGGPVVMVAVMSSLTPNSDAAPRESGKWECRAQGRKTAAAIGGRWGADAVVLYAREQRVLCVETLTARVRLAAEEESSVMVGAQDALALGAPDLALAFALMSLKDASVVAAGRVVVPSRRELLQVAVAGMIPFIGFGITDNGIMILAGEAIEDFIGARIEMSTMASAAWGNLVSDMAGVFLGGTVAQIAHRLGAVEPPLTHAQKALPQTIQSKLVGEAVGVGLGCWFGMAPLLFMHRRGGKSAAAPPIQRDISALGSKA